MRGWAGWGGGGVGSSGGIVVIILAMSGSRCVTAAWIWSTASCMEWERKSGAQCVRAEWMFARTITTLLAFLNVLEVCSSKSDLAMSSGWDCVQSRFHQPEEFAHSAQERVEVTTIIRFMLLCRMRCKGIGHSAVEMTRGTQDSALMMAAAIARATWSAV